MKTALTIICSLLLALTPAMGWPPLPACPAMTAHASCGCGGKMPCCAARSSSHSNPAPLTLASVSAQNPVSAPVPAAEAWRLPDSQAFSASFQPAAGASPAAGAPLYTRNCALLI